MPDARTHITTGLSSTDARARLERDGPNQLPPLRRPSALRRFADQLVHFFAVMLWVASGLALLAGLPALGVAIAIVVVLNATFAFAQEHKADRAAERLRALLPRRVTVRRDRRVVPIDAADVVVDDVLVLSAGDRIPADATVAEAHGLLMDTSLLTGESEATATGPDSTIFAGTFVVEGEGAAIVTGTGDSTRLAGISRLTTETRKPPSPLTLELRKVVRSVAVIAVAVGVTFFGVALLLGNEASDGLVFAVGVTVALVPEALLPTVTLALAWGAERMADRNVLVRDLDAVETLGSTTFICTDKTGTLTVNRMAVVEAWTPGGSATIRGEGYDPQADVDLSSPAATPAVERLALGAARCSTGHVTEVDGEWRASGDPMEAALDVLARRLGFDTDADRRARPPSIRFPFDPRRRRMSVVVGGEVLVKGAPDAVLPLCADEQAITVVLEDMTARGLRVLAVAGRPVGARPPRTADEAESGLRCHGLVALEDPPRHDVDRAIEACRRAGIKLAMITGDHPGTASAIATEVGLRSPDDPVVVGQDLPTDDEALGALLDHDGVVVARVSPEQKRRIAAALRARGHVIAMTGDGVNDGPALHEADIGIAMGRSGTDVAREASDLVLLDDHFATLVAGVEQGRATFLNIRRFLTYHLTDNVAEVTPFLVWALSGERIPLALGVLQILAIDIGTDTLSAVALGTEPPGRDVLDRPPVSGRLLNGTVLRRAFGVLGPTVALGSMVAFLASFAAAGWRPGDPFPDGHAALAASGAAFMTVVIAQTANAFACRSATRRPGELGWTSNRLLVPAVAIAVAISLVTIFLGPLADLLEHANPPPAGWVTAFATAWLLLTVDAADKRRRRHRVAATPAGVDLAGAQPGTS